jgi:hypothetical protein
MTKLHKWSAKKIARQDQLDRQNISPRGRHGCAKILAWGEGVREGEIASVAR